MRIGELAARPGSTAQLQRMQGDLDRLAARARGLSPTDCAPAGVCHVLDRPRRPAQF